jgi:hypothetical protein
MSAESPHSVDGAAVAQQVEDVFRESDALAKALARARSIRRWLGLLTLVLVLLIVVVFYRFGRQFIEPEFADKLVKTAQDRFQKNSDQYMKEVQLLVDGVSPVLSDAFAQQVKKDMPGYFQAMEKERDQLLEALVPKLEKKIEDHYLKLLEKQDKTLREEFPAINDTQLHERMVKNIDTAMQKLVKKYYADELEAQVKDLRGSWDRFPPAPAPRPGDPTAEDQFIAELLDMLRYKLSHSAEVAVQR